MSTWTAVDSSFPLATCSYSFGPGEANSLLVGIDGGVAVISPPCRVPDSVLDAAAAFGPVKALVASNAFHHMGLPAWKKRFPDAKVFAPAQAVARVTKQSGLPDIAPLAELKSLTGPRVDIIDMPHYKTGEVLVRARTASGNVWYITDILMNMPKMPRGPVGMLFKWTGSGPGFKFNNVAAFLMVKDKPALKRWLIGQVEEAPPSTIVSCHGDNVQLSDPLAQLREVIQA
jgi:hypothetical protein